MPRPVRYADSGRVGTTPEGSASRTSARPSNGGNAGAYRVAKAWTRASLPQSLSLTTTLIALRTAFSWAIKPDRLAAGRNRFANAQLLPGEGRRRGVAGE